MIERFSKILCHRVHGFSDSNRYYTADGTGPALNVTAFSWWVVIEPVRNNESNNIQFIFGRSSWNNANRGWGFRQFTGTTRPIVDQDVVGTATIDQKSAQGFATVWGELNKLQVIHTVFRNGVMYTYKNGCLLGYEGNNGPGLSKPSVINPMPVCGIGFGGYAGTQSQIKSFEGGIITAGICESTGLTGEQVRDHYFAIVGGNVSAAPTGASHLWRAQDAGDTWTDTISGLVATKFGSPLVTQKYYDFYPAYDFTYDYTLDRVISPPLSSSPRIWCIGDSRTAEKGSYRLYCQYNKASSGISGLTWVGRYPNPSSFYADIIGYNEQTNGMPGRSTGDCLYGSSGFGTYEVEIANANPDVVIMWFGNNSADLEDQVITKKNFSLLIGKTFAYNPNIRILLLSEICTIRQQGSQNTLTMEAKTRDISVFLVKEAAKWQAMGKHVYNVKVDDTIPWDEDTDWLDVTHPRALVSISEVNENFGYNKMGRKVWLALQRICGYQPI